MLVRCRNRNWLQTAFLLLAFAWFFSFHTANAQTPSPIFPITTSIPVTTPSGSVVYGFAVGNLNGNAEPDLAYTVAIPGTTGGNYLSVLLDFTGSSPTSASSSINCTPANASPVLGDVNNDGKLDVIVTCANYLVVLLGNGNGTFQAPAYYALATPGIPALVDLNGDKYLDIAVTSAPSNATVGQITVLLNNGSSSPGTFATPVNYGALIGSARYVAAGDFNGDGKQDVIAATSTTSGVGFLLFLGNGDGTLQPPIAQPSVQNATQSFATGDFNKDGTTDIAVLASTSLPPTAGSPSSVYTGMQVLLGNSSGTMTVGSSVALQPMSTVVGISNAALTSSGNLDLIVSGPNTIILHGDGKGNFTQTGAYAAYGDPFSWDINGDGKPDLLLADSLDLEVFPLLGNGDGSFQGIPSIAVNGGFPDHSASTIVSADFNGDGIADSAYIMQSATGQSMIAVNLGRGNGTFAPLDQISTTSGTFLATGDFNNDGKEDVVAIGAGGSVVGRSGDIYPAGLFFYAGNGDGTFKPAGPGVNLLYVSVEQAVVGDFNGDGKIDLVITFEGLNGTIGDYPGAGLIFLPGNGDGTFGTPVLIGQLPNPGAGPLLAADLNHDGKLDLVWQTSGGNAVLLGNGDGTFRQIPLNLTPATSILALGDVNGDGYPDLVVGASIYAGNGDGTFQTTPLYTAPIPASSTVQSAAVADINGDGNPDLVAYYGSSSPGFSQLSVSYGNGQGGFTSDSNTYFAGSLANPTSFIGRLLLTRLNNSAPTPSSDHTLDALVFTGGALTGMLNQENPAPSAPPVLTSSMTLQSSAASANENASITLTATVLGTNPTGDVVFSSNGTSLGSAPLSNGTATLQTSFASAGTYAVTATYSGDAHNSASASNTVSITVAAPDFTVASNPTSAAITAGQTATFSLTVTPRGGYVGTVNLSCGSLPSKVTCSFSPSAITPTNGSSAKGTLTISTTAAVAALDIPPASGGTPWLPAGTLTVAGLLGLFINPLRLTRWNRRLWMLACVAMLCCAGLCLSGCGGSSTNGSSSGNQGTPGTPSGSYAIVVSLTDSAGGPAHTLNLNVTVQ